MNKAITFNELEKEISGFFGSKSITRQTYLEFVRKALDAKRAYPENRAKIAYIMVSLGSSFLEPDIDIKEIKDLFADLELPDGHVNTSDGLSVAQKWDKIAKLYSRLNHLGIPDDFTML